jgi:hypothetical protein
MMGQISSRALLGVTVLVVVSLLASATPTLGDCNRNGTSDVEDVRTGRSADCNENGVPDECEVFPLPLGADIENFDTPATSGLATGDLDGDGRVDVAVGLWDATNRFRLGVFLHRGGREFDAVFLPILKRLDGLDAGDLDGDGDLDLVGVSPNFLHRFTNDGDGIFSQEDTVELEGTPTDVVLVDLDGDGNIDVAFADRVLDAIVTMRNDGTGVFGEPVAFDVGDSPRAIVASDPDDDGDADLIVVSSSSSELDIRLNDGRGGFARSSTIILESTPYQVATLDFDGDGTTDIVAAGDGGVVIVGLDGTQLTERFSIDLGPSFRVPSSIVVVDANDDGVDDVVVGYPGGEGLVTLLGGFDVEPAYISHPVSTDVFRSLAAGDLDGNGVPDLVGGTATNVQILWGGEPRPRPAFEQNLHPHPAEPHWATIDDFDNDGVPDVVVSDGGVGSITIQGNDGSGRLTPSQVSREAGYINSVTSADFDQDGTIDVAVTSWRRSSAIVLLRDEGGVSQRSYPTGNSPFFIIDALLDDDDYPDLVTGNPGSNSVSVMLNAGDGTFRPQQRLNVGLLPQTIAVGDFDGDQDIDLAVGNLGNSISILTNDGEGVFDESARIAVPRMLTVGTGDFDNDGDLDLAVTHLSSRVLLFENRGGEFSEQGHIAMDRVPSWVISTDLNQDGIVDLVTSNTQRGPTFPPNRTPAPAPGSVTLIMGTGPFTFEAPVSIEVGRDPRAILAADMNRDGLQDIVVINHDDETISVLLNRSRRASDQSYLERVCTELDFFELSVPARGGSRRRVLKYVVPADPRDESLLPPLFQNVRIHPLHQEFLAATFPERFPNLARAVYDALVHRRATREYFVGNLFHLRSGGRSLYGFSVITGGFDNRDELPRLEEVRGIRQMLSEVFDLRDLVYFPETTAERESAAAWGDAPFEVFLEEPDPDFTFEAYTRGVAFGRVRVLDAEAFAAANDEGRFGFQDLLVLEQTPRDIEGVVAGVLTATVQTVASHVAVRTARRGTPNAYSVDAVDVFGDLEGDLVRFEVRATDFIWRPATSVEANAWWEENRRELSELPTVDEEFRDLPALDEIDLDGEIAAESRVGGKAANFARLQRVFVGSWSEYRLPGFAIPLAYYLDFLRANRTLSFINPLRVVTYEEYLDELFASEEFSTDSRFRFEALERLRDIMVGGGEVDPDLVASLAARIEEVFGTTTEKVRFRSSSNVEDALEFNGAGLYDSYSACAADDLDEGDDGPSECDAGEGTERGIARALKRVWASLWNFRAYEERSFYGIPQDLSAMGVLVSTAFSGEIANGVVFSANPADPFDRRYLVSAQIGESSVVSPAPGTLVEKDLLEVVDGEVRDIVRAVSSSMVPEGVAVLSDEQLAEIAAVVSEIDRSLEIDRGEYDRDRVLLDIEFKIDADGDLVFKQVRPFLTNELDGPAPTFALEIPVGAKACATFREFRTLRDTLRLKSVLTFAPGVVSLPTNRSYFVGDDLISEIQLGTDREVLTPSGIGVYRVTRDPVDDDSFTFSFQQDFELASGERFAVRLEGLSFRVGDASPRTFDGESLEGLVTLQGELDGSFVNYGSCSYEELPLWEIDVALSDGSTIRLRERHEPPLDLTVTNPARLIRAELDLAGTRRVVDDYWHLVYTAARHNVDVEYWVVLDPPLDLDRFERSVHVVEVIAERSFPRVFPSVRYLDEDFEMITSPTVRSYDREESRDDGGPQFVRGDIAVDGEINLTDAVSLLQHLFTQGAPPPCQKAADANDDGSVNLSDAVGVLDHLFRGVPSLPAPFGECGADPTTDSLTCEGFEACVGR